MVPGLIHHERAGRRIGADRAAVLEAPVAGPAGLVATRRVRRERLAAPAQREVDIALVEHVGPPCTIGPAARVARRGDCRSIVRGPTAASVRVVGVVACWVAFSGVGDIRLLPSDASWCAGHERQERAEPLCELCSDAS